jgi:hypothetical protein
MPRFSILYYLFKSFLFITVYGYAQKHHDFDSSEHDYEAPEPYRELHGFCSNCNLNIPQSPDPLVATTWNSDVDATKLQYYRVSRPVEYIASPNDAIKVVRSNRSSSLFLITIHKNCSLMIDWGVERAGWMELISPNDLSPSSTQARVQAALSEFQMPYPGKTKPLVRYGNFTYRLETNKELYEGVRFTWLYFEMLNNTSPIQIQDISLVAKVKPVNYTGSFMSSSEDLTIAWYTGAYGVRLNMGETNFNSILVERGDRVAIQGDGHPTMDAALVAFSPYKLVKQVLNQTDSGDHRVVDEGIMAYPLFWSLSVMSYFMESGDIDTFSRLAGDIMKILNARIDDFLAPDLDIQWFGWDDRLGNGWCFHSNGDRCPKEAHLAFAGLVVRVCRDFANVLSLANMPVSAQKYKLVYHELGQRLTATPEWPHAFGVHAAANAINSGIAKKNETDLWMTSVLNDAVTVCSVSQFNQYWILQAFGNAHRMEHAIASIKLCWGAPLKLGRGCFWENSSPDWLSFLKEGDAAPGLPSYCHPWASGVTAWLSHSLAGIQPLLPGYKSFLASPYVSGQNKAVSASISTPAGKILVNATLVEDEMGEVYRFHALIQSPGPGYFGLRKYLACSNGENDGHLQSVQVNQRHVSPMTHRELQDMLGVAADFSRLSDTLLFVDLQAGGTFVISATYRKKAETKETHRIADLAPFPEPWYQASIIGVDSVTRGDGLTIHGKDGYVLVGYNAGNDVVNLPDYIRNVTIWKHGFPGWIKAGREFIGVSSDDKTYLPMTDSSVRKLGMVGYDDSRGGQINNLFLHVEAKQPGRPFSLSVYFVAKSADSKHSIRIMDLKSLNVIAPAAFIQNYTHGVWWTVKYHGSIRLRMSNVQGIRVSAIAFA